MAENLKIVFVTNFYTFHQTALSEVLYRLTKENYRFIETVRSQKAEKRSGMKFDDIPFLMQYFDPAQREACEKWIQDADVVIVGGAPDKLMSKRLRKRKLTFRYSERSFKEKLSPHRYFRALVSAWLHHGRFARKPLFMLCASAYTAADCRKFGNYKNKAYRWGYFPEVMKYPNFDEFVAKKKPGSILWCGRLIPLKHPEAGILTAKRLKDAGIPFDMNFIGKGPMRSVLQKMVAEYQLEDCVHILGQMSTQDVRRHMEQTEIFLFTSDRREGWGAVLNEAMNSACAVIASHAIGSVPFLLRDEDNGMIYQDGNMDDLYEKTKKLLQTPHLCRLQSKRAYETICCEWNAETAAKRFLETAQQILDKKQNCFLYESGPCSRAEILKDDWYL